MHTIFRLASIGVFALLSVMCLAHLRRPLSFNLDANMQNHFSLRLAIITALLMLSSARAANAEILAIKCENTTSPEVEPRILIERDFWIDLTKSSATFIDKTTFGNDPPMTIPVQVTATSFVLRPSMNPFTMYINRKTGMATGKMDGFPEVNTYSCTKTSTPPPAPPAVKF